MESVAAFANNLIQHLDVAPGSKPSAATIESLFNHYQGMRESRVRMMYRSTHFMTRVGTWDTISKKFFARWLLPWRDDVAALSVLLAGAVKVDFIPIPSRSKGFHQTLPQNKKSDSTLTQQMPWDAMLMIMAVLRGAAYFMVFGMQRSSHSLGLRE